MIIFASAIMVLALASCSNSTEQSETISVDSVTTVAASDTTTPVDSVKDVKPDSLKELVK